MYEPPVSMRSMFTSQCTFRHASSLSLHLPASNLHTPHFPVPTLPCPHASLSPHLPVPTPLSCDTGPQPVSTPPCPHTFLLPQHPAPTLQDRNLDSTAKSEIGTAMYAAPEIVHLSPMWCEHGYNAQMADVWSCGVVRGRGGPTALHLSPMWCEHGYNAQMADVWSCGVVSGNAGRGRGKSLYVH